MIRNGLSINGLQFLRAPYERLYCDLKGKTLYLLIEFN